jgi:hypothetical protein
MTSQISGLSTGGMLGDARVGTRELLSDRRWSLALRSQVPLSRLYIQSVARFGRTFEGERGMMIVLTVDEDEEVVDDENEGQSVK